MHFGLCENSECRINHDRNTSVESAGSSNYIYLLLCDLHFKLFQKKLNNPFPKIK